MRPARCGCPSGLGLIATVDTPSRGQADNVQMARDLVLRSRKPLAD